MRGRKKNLKIRAAARLPFGYALFKAFMFVSKCLEQEALNEDQHHGFKIFIELLKGASSVVTLVGAILFVIFLSFSFYELTFKKDGQA